LANLGIGEDFLAEVEESLRPGKAAVVAEVWEEWTTPIDTRMEALGGIVFRRTRWEVLDGQIRNDVAMLKADLIELKAERDQAVGEARGRLQRRMDATKARLQSTQDAVLARIELSQNVAEAKITSLREQAVRENGERKAKREARIAELKADQKRRSDLLQQAWDLTKQALSG
jgi:hypothetical protein